MTTRPPAIVSPPPGKSPGLAVRAAGWSARHPGRAITLWLLLVLVAVAMVSLVPTQDTDSSDGRHGDSGRASAMLDGAGFPGADDQGEAVLITARSGALDRDSAGQAAADLAARLPDVAGVSGIDAPALNPSGTALLVSFRVGPDVTDPAPMQAVTAAVQRQFPGLDVRETGDVTVGHDVDSQVSRDLRGAERLSLPITLILMLVAFGALIAAGLPVLLAGTSVVATIGLMAPISHLVHLDPSVSSLIVLIGMAVGVDYSLFYLKREREERAKGHSTRDALAIAAQTSGHSILVSGGAVIVAMSGLLLLSDATFNSIAVGAALVVAVAMTGSVTVLPALLVKLGRWVDRPRVPLLWRANRRIGRGGLSRRLLAPVTRHPAVALGISLTAVVLLAAPAFSMRTHSDDLDTLPRSISSAQTLRAISAEFPAEQPTADVVVQAPAARQGEVEQALTRLGSAAAQSGLLVTAGATPEVSPSGTTTRLALTMPYAESDPRVARAITVLRTELAPRALDGVATHYAVGGDAAEALDWSANQDQRLPFVIGFVLLLTLLLMGVTFRSGPIAVISALLNLASVGVAFGAITLVFQDGWFEGALGFHSPGFIIDWLPVFVMTILVGLSMDYHVFVLSRIREYVERGLPTRLAVERGVADTAGVVTSAAAVMVAVFSIFATLSLLQLKTMGVGLAVAILLDATLIRLVMLPAILCLLGERVWWPRRPVPLVGDAAVVAQPALGSSAVAGGR